MSAADALREFADLQLWVTWRNETRQADKPTKVPYSHARPDGQLDRSSTWTTRAIAEHAARRENREGIGIVLAPLGGAATSAASISTPASTTRATSPRGRERSSNCWTATPRSRRGQGLKIYFLHDPRVTLAKGMHWRSAVRRPALNGGKEPGIEFYLRARYFTVTDQTFEGFDTVRLSTSIRCTRCRPRWRHSPTNPRHHPSPAPP